MAHGVSGKLLEERLGRNGGCEGTGRGISLVSLWGDVEGMFFLLFCFLGRDGEGGMFWFRDGMECNDDV